MDLTEIIHFDNNQRHPWELARYQVVKEHVRNILIPFNAESATVLDIGCGDAFLVHQLALDFPKVAFIGVDINFSDDLIEQLKHKIKVPNLSIYKNLDELDLPGNSVNAILLLDVIEHIEDEISFLKSLPEYRFIHKETVFLITVPAFQTLFAGHDVVLGHFRRYSNKTLRNRLKQAGYTTNYERYFFVTLIPPRIFQVIKETFFSSDTQRPSDLASWKGGYIITSLIRKILILDYRIGSLLKYMGIKLPGLSNLVICRRSV
jgi:ubiquinone/menaquinone biosynthesis C-methylase UbiE